MIIIIIVIMSSLWKRLRACRKTVYRLHAYPSGNLIHLSDETQEIILSRYRTTERIKLVSESKFFYYQLMHNRIVFQ